ncbi:hypothetical protein EHS25_005927 [Saitozyma podzolica]|uniref:Transcriptional coactivator p15 (PC4) C-terminal domain-containing protein n=1 Tax=Saitozyma podzolica TaxID=1890683 RepID=A0A427XTU3_9TREE|nr:hypothetical protein EHS25_005927 [Saitozyma podzolica]
MGETDRPDRVEREDGSSTKEQVEVDRKRKYDSADESSESDSKKQRSTNTGGGAVTTHKNDQAEEYFNLTEYRRVTVREFKGKTLVDIREHYKDKTSGEMKPGSKGISLTREQWETLKANMDVVDAMIKRKEN